MLKTVPKKIIQPLTDSLFFPDISLCCKRHDYVTNLEVNIRDHVIRKRAENEHRMGFNQHQNSLSQPVDQPCA